MVKRKADHIYVVYMRFVCTKFGNIVLLIFLYFLSQNSAVNASELLSSNFTNKLYNMETERGKGYLTYEFLDVIFVPFVIFHLLKLS